ncbi:MAG: autotransporter outer membrane beta-barrel domain-containing protein [Acidobacteriota bacterium]
MDHHNSRAHTPSPIHSPFFRLALRRTLSFAAAVVLGLSTPGAVTAQDESGVTILGGDGQRGAVGEVLGRSFRVRVVDAGGGPIAGAAVQWNVIFGDAQLQSGGVTTSDANGEARNRLLLGSRVGLVQVAVRAAGADGSEIFTAKVDAEADPVRSAFDRACNDDLSRQAGVCAYVDGLSEDDQLLVREELEPDEIAAQATVTQEIARAHLDAVTTRLVALRRGGVDQKRLGFFISGSTATAERPRDLDEAAFDNDSTGLTVGLDYRFGDSAVVGVAAGAFDADADFFDDAGSLDVESQWVSLYLGKTWASGVYLHGVAGVGTGDYDAVRNIDLPVAFRGKTRFAAVGTPDGDQTAAQLELGYTRKLQSELVLTGFLRGRYIDLTIDGYREIGDADGLGFYLDVLEQNVESLMVEGGFDLAWPLKRRWGTLTPSVQLSLVRELDDQGEPIRARFLDDPNANLLVLPTAEPDENFINFSAGLIAHLNNGTGLFVHYSIDLERADYELEELRGGVSFSF